MSQPIISVSGLRGIVGDSLHPELAMRFAAAFAAVRPPGPLVLTRDGRATGPLLADAIRAALCGVGRIVIDAGVASTPTAGVLVREHRAAGGIQISASHNPPEYNGIKLFDGEGSVLSADAGNQVLAQYQAGSPQWVPHDRVGHSKVCENPLARHAGLVLATIDADRVRSRRFKVLLDSNHGAGGELGERLLRELGCDSTLLGREPNGHFAHTPEPTAENLAGIADQVRRAGADIGFCQDPDADRLAVIDERGRYVGEEYTLALCLDHVLRERPGPVVTNCATSRMSEDLAKRYGAPFFRSAVGEANVVSTMKEQSAVFGGEGNGGPIDPRVGYVRDSFVGMALILDAMASRNLPLSRLADELPSYAIHKAKLSLDRAQVSAAFDTLETCFDDATASRLDGLRLDWADRWLLIRGSNTEPIVRLIAEAPSIAEARELCERAAAVIA